MTEATHPVSSHAADLPTPHRCPWLMQFLLICPLRRLLESPDKLLASHVQPGMTVLEPGCGMGYFSLPLARMVGPEGRLLCVDVEPRAVARLERRARRAGLSDRITASVCDARSLGLNEHAGQVDLAFVAHTLHEFEDLQGFLAQVHTLLVPGGRMLVFEPAGHVRANEFDAMMACCEEAGLSEIDRPGQSRKQWAALLQRD